MKNLTINQLLVYEFIRTKIIEGIPPTRQDICDKFGYKSANAADSMVKAIIKKGYLVHVPMISRGLRLP